MSEKRRFRPTLDYPFDTAPEGGTTLEIAPNLQWLRMPLPFSLNHINLWLLNDGDGFAIVDTGLRGRKTRELWGQVVATQNGRLPTRLIVTHMHPDHAGSGGWLCDNYNLDLYMTQLEYLTCRMLAADIAPPPPAAIDHFKAAGLDDEQLATYVAMFGSFGKGCDALPPSYKRIKAGDVLKLGDTDWQIVGGNGHSPEHACLYNATDNVMISGDQLLPNISSNVSVWPQEPDANPLRDWLASCQHLIDVLPADVLVCPSHGKPFRGAHQRAKSLIDEHHDGLRKLSELCREPQRAVDVFPALFRSRVPSGEFVMATGEAIAHLNYLRFEGVMNTWLDDAGIRWYQMAHRTS